MVHTYYQIFKQHTPTSQWSSLTLLLGGGPLVNRREFILIFFLFFFFFNFDNLFTACGEEKKTYSVLNEPHESVTAYKLSLNRRKVPTI